MSVKKLRPAGRQTDHGIDERKERATQTYRDRQRSFKGARSGWGGVGFGMSTGHEAYDAELTAIAYGLLLLARRGERGRRYTIFTDSRAAMTRVTSDAPGTGQEIAI